MQFEQWTDVEQTLGDKHHVKVVVKKQSFIFRLLTCVCIVYAKSYFLYKRVYNRPYVKWVLFNKI